MSVKTFLRSIELRWTHQRLVHDVQTATVKNACQERVKFCGATSAKKTQAGRVSRDADSHCPNGGKPYGNSVRLRTICKGRLCSCGHGPAIVPSPRGHYDGETRRVTQVGGDTSQIAAKCIAARTDQSGPTDMFLLICRNDSCSPNPGRTG
jgi:hypothetical protein